MLQLSSHCRGSIWLLALLPLLGVAAITLYMLLERLSAQHDRQHSSTQHSSRNETLSECMNTSVGSQLGGRLLPASCSTIAWPFGPLPSRGADESSALHLHVPLPPTIPVRNHS